MISKCSISLLVCGLLFLNSCTVTTFHNLNAKTFTATDTDKVELFFKPDQPPRAFEPIGYVDVNVFNSGKENRAAVLTTMKKRAAKKGANAVVNIDMQYLGDGIRISFIGLAVKWKE